MFLIFVPWWVILIAQCFKYDEVALCDRSIAAVVSVCSLFYWLPTGAFQVLFDKVHVSAVHSGEILLSRMDETDIVIWNLSHLSGHSIQFNRRTSYLCCLLKLPRHGWPPWQVDLRRLS